jgi:hypothetical protein
MKQVAPADLEEIAREQFEYLILASMDPSASKMVADRYIRLMQVLLEPWEVPAHPVSSSLRSRRQSAGACAPEE